MLEIFLTEDSSVEDLLCGAPSSSEALLFFSDDLLCLRLQPVQYDPQHDFAWVASEANRSVVLALLQVAFLGRCNGSTGFANPIFLKRTTLFNEAEKGDIKDLKRGHKK